jgi:hypothetical protein
MSSEVYDTTKEPMVYRQRVVLGGEVRFSR